MYKCTHWTRCDENSPGDFKNLQGFSQSETNNFFETKAGKWRLVYHAATHVELKENIWTTISQELNVEGTKETILI